MSNSQNMWNSCLELYEQERYGDIVDLVEENDNLLSTDFRQEKDYFRQSIEDWEGKMITLEPGVKDEGEGPVYDIPFREQLVAVWESNNSELREIISQRIDVHSNREYSTVDDIAFKDIYSKHGNGRHPNISIEIYNLFKSNVESDVFGMYVESLAREKGYEEAADTLNLQLKNFAAEFPSIGELPFKEKIKQQVVETFKNMSFYK